MSTSAAVITAGIIALFFGPVLAADLAEGGEMEAEGCDDCDVFMEDLVGISE